MREINISTIIAAKRKEKGLTQEELAAYMGVTKASVSKWETGQSYPDITLLPQLAAYFNISIDELVGYQPQMSQEDIVKTYNRLSHDFSCRPFDEVYGECLAIIKKYHACFPLLLEMAALLINHYLQPPEKEKQEAVLHKVIEICEHIKSGCHDIWLAKQANSLQAMSYLVLQKPLEVLELLDGTLKPISGDEVILANAWQMKGNPEKARTVLQVSIYQHLIILLGLAPSYLMLHLQDVPKMEIILQRFLLMAEAFQIETIRPDLLAQMYYMAALAYAGQNQAAETLEMLERYTAICSSKHFFKIFQEGLHGDPFFDAIESWFAEYQLMKKIPRDRSVVKEDMVKVVRDHPSFAFLADEPQYKNLIRSLEMNVGKK